MSRNIDDRILEIAGVKPTGPEFGRCPSCEEVLNFGDENEIECPGCGMIVDLEEAKKKLVQMSDEIKL